MYYHDTMERIFTYFSACGKVRTPLLGVNPDSASDRQKAKFMLSHGEPHESIFYNDCGIAACMDNFLKVRENFDSLIITNDVVMFAALSILREASLNFPNDYYAVSFSDTMLAPIYESSLSPKISAFSLDYYELGKQCAELWNYIFKNSADVCATVRLKASFIPNLSTEYRAFPEKNGHRSFAASDPYNFYSDDIANEVIALENCLTKCDKTDFRIIDLLLKNESRARIAMELFISEGALYYRERRLNKLAGTSSVAQLKALVKKYL